LLRAGNLALLSLSSHISLAVLLVCKTGLLGEIKNSWIVRGLKACVEVHGSNKEEEKVSASNLFHEWYQTARQLGDRATAPVFMSFTLS